MCETVDNFGIRTLVESFNVRKTGKLYSWNSELVQVSSLGLKAMHNRKINKEK